MRKKTLTDKLISSKKTSRAQEDISDGVVTGLTVRFFKTGAKKFYLRYRTPAGTQRKILLGDARILSLANARTKARNILASIQQGQDPLRQKQEYRAASTVEQLVEQFLEYSKVNNRPKTYYEDARLLKKEVLPFWGNLKICDVKRKDAIVLLERIKNSKRLVLCNRVHQILSRLFSFAVEREVAETNIFRDLKKLVREKSRSRVLSDDELRLFLQALDEEQNQVITNGLKLILLLGRRRTEVFGARWSEFVDNVWTLPAERSKNKKTIRIPLLSQAISILDEMRKYNSQLPVHSEFVFPSRHHSKHIVEPGKTMRSIVQKLGMPSFCVHDLRRTTASHMQALDISGEAIESILGHAIRGVAGVYQRGDRLNEMKRALTRWASKLDVLAGKAPEAQKIVALHSRS